MPNSEQDFSYLRAKHKQFPYSTYLLFDLLRLSYTKLH